MSDLSDWDRKWFFADCEQNNGCCVVCSRLVRDHLDSELLGCVQKYVLDGRRKAELEESLIEEFEELGNG